MARRRASLSGDEESGGWPALRTRLGIGLAVLVSLYLLYLLADSFINFRTVRAEVVAVTHGCALSRVQTTTRGRARDDRGPFTCEEAQRLKASPDFADYALHQVQTVTFRYVSPADGSTQSVTHPDIQHIFPAVAPGGALDIMAHAYQPATWRRVD